MSESGATLDVCVSSRCNFVLYSWYRCNGSKALWEGDTKSGGVLYQGIDYL